MDPNCLSDLPERPGEGLKVFKGIDNIVGRLAAVIGAANATVRVSTGALSNFASISDCL